MWNLARKYLRSTSRLLVRKVCKQKIINLATARIFFRLYPTKLTETESVPEHKMFQTKHLRLQYQICRAKRLYNKRYLATKYQYSTLPAAARSKAWICGRSLAGILGSNPAGVWKPFLSRKLCVDRQRSLRRADHSSRGVLPCIVSPRVMVKP